ncbi:hypothetical protein [Nannocystis pusilla]|uniref:hypothetical protein n=1 Tax=Nannocystis pusilla TaxID=889268 RepID=UPI003BF0F4FC
MRETRVANLGVGGKFVSHSRSAQHLQGVMATANGPFGWPLRGLFFLPMLGCSPLLLDAIGGEDNDGICPAGEFADIHALEVPTNVVRGAAVGPDGAVVMVGEHSIGFFVAKFDVERSLSWLLNLDEDLEPATVALDDAGNIAVAGWRPPGTDPGPRAAFLTSVSPEGEHLKTLEYPLESSAVLDDIVIDLAREALVVATSQDVTAPADDVPRFRAVVTKHSFGGGATWERALEGATSTRIARSPSGDVVVGGSFAGTIDFGEGPLYANVDRNSYLLKLSPLGDPQWFHQAPRETFGGQAVLMSVAADASGTIYVAGEFDDNFGDGPNDPGGSQSPVFVVALDNQGRRIWSRRYANQGDESSLVSRLTINDAGHAVLVGEFADHVGLGDDRLVNASNTGHAVFVALLQTDGTFVWSAKVDGAAKIYSAFATLDGNGVVGLAGLYGGTLVIGGREMSGGGWYLIDFCS